MNALLLALFYTSGILLYGNGLPYGDLFSKYETLDDYYEDYYLRKIPKPKTSADKVKEFIINHLSWFPVDDLENERERDCRQNRRSDDIWNEIFIEPCEVKSTTCKTPIAKATKHRAKPENATCGLKKKVAIKVKNLTMDHHFPKNWTIVKNHSSQSIHAMREYMERKHIKEVMKNVTHPLRYRGPLRNCTKHKECNEHDENNENNENNVYKELQNIFYTCKCPPKKGCKVHHPKSSHVEVIKKHTTPFPESFLDSHFSIPRRIKVIIDLKNENRPTKSQRRVDDKDLANVEGDNNSTHVLETAGEMASDLAGKVTSLWHSVVGQHHEKTALDLKDVRFYLYTRRNIIRPELLKVNYDLIQKKVQENPRRIDVPCAEVPPDEIGDFQRISDENREIIKSNFLNLKAPTKILIHGYTGNYKDSRMAKIKDAYLDNGRYNVIQVDWEALAAPPCYIKVTHHSKFVGETIAQFLNGLHLVGLNMSLVHLVGFSLGAQVAGFTGNNATITPVCRITGLDPALPLFLHTEPSGHLDKFDAKFVDVIHTCGGILAMLDPLGHVDFYPNGGTRQPGCEFSNLKCSHSRAPQYFAESINSQKKFTGQLCLNWDEYVAGDCNNVTDISFMGEPCSRKSLPGKYYLMTKSKEPFVL